ncbi:MAG: pilus assembly protein PilM [Patescibacteria group bacterium]
MSLFKNKVESYLGVDIGSNGIKLVEIKKTKNRPQLWTYAILDKKLDVHISIEKEKEAIDILKMAEKKYSDFYEKQDVVATQNYNDFVLQDKRVEKYAKYLKELVTTAKVNSKIATSSLPVSQVFHTVINLPIVEEKEIQGIVNAEIAKMISRPIEEMQVIYQKINGENKDNKFISLLVTAAPKSLIAFYTLIFKKAGLELIDLETEAFAISRSLVGYDSSVVMVVDIGAENTDLLIVDKGIPMTNRSLQIGGDDIDEILMKKLSLDKEQVVQIKKDLSSNWQTDLTDDIFLSVLDPLAKEIQYSFDLYFKQTGNAGKKPEKIILTGGSSFFPPIEKYLKTQFSLNVFIGDPWARVIYQNGLKNTLDTIGPRMAVSIGLALKNFK